MHAPEMAVERHMKALASQNLVAGDVPFFMGAGAIGTMSPPRSII